MNSSELDIRRKTNTFIPWYGQLIDIILKISIIGLRSQLLDYDLNYWIKMSIIRLRSQLFD